MKLFALALAASAAFLAGSAQAGTWEYNAWTDDTDSGITSASAYTVAVNCNGGAVTVNGVAFEAHVLSGPDFSIGGGVGPFGPATPNVTGDSVTLANTFIYGGNPRTVTLKNLTPGATYETSFFAYGFEASGRIQTFASGSDSLELDQDLYGADNGIRISYTFVADFSGSKVLTITPVNPDSTFHMSALANRKVSDAPPATILSFGTNVIGSSAVFGLPVANAATIAWTVPYGTVLSALAPALTLSSGTCTPPSGTVRDFSAGPLTYTVTDGGTINTYTVTVTIAPPRTACDITAFNPNFTGSSAIISTTSPTAGTVIVFVPFGTTEAQVAALAPTYTLSLLATCNQPNSANPTPALSLTAPVHYIVTANDGVTTKDYTVTIVVAPLITETDQSDAFAEGTDGYQANVPSAALNILAAPGTTLALSGGAPANPPDGGGGTSTSWSTLIDGSFGLVPPSGGGGPGEVAVFDNWILTYTFPISYKIASIDVFTGWGDGGRMQPNVTVNYSADGNTFLPLQAINYAASGNSAWVHLDVTGLNAIAIQFAFGPQQNGYVGYTELAVQGTAPLASILSFGSNVAGSSAPIDQTAKTIAWTVPYGTVLSALAPTISLTSGTCSPPSGTVRDFGAGPVTYTVTDGGTINTYTVTVTFAPPSTAKVMSDVLFPGLGYAVPVDGTGTNLVLYVPSGTPVTGLAPTYVVSEFASGSPVSGTSRSFTTPQTYTVTAQDGSQQAYSVAVVPLAAGQGYSALVLAAGPVAYWPLGEFTDTTAADITGHGHDGVYSGEYILGLPGLVPLNSGAAVAFTNDATVTVPYSDSLNPTNFTVEFWAKPSDLAVAYVVAMQDRSTGARIGYAIQKNNYTAGWDFTFGTGPSADDTIASGTAVAAGSVYHVAATYDGTAANLYVNGALASSRVTTYEPATPYAVDFTIGSRNGNTPVHAIMQHVAFYDRALTPQEIQNHFNGKVAPPVLGFVPNPDGTFTLTWTNAMLLEAGNVMGPWATNAAAVSPLKVTPAQPQGYYRLQAP